MKLFSALATDGEIKPESVKKFLHRATLSKAGVSTDSFVKRIFDRFSQSQYLKEDTPGIKMIEFIDHMSPKKIPMPES